MAVDPKAVARRLIEQVINAARLERIAEGEKVVGRFLCSATNLGPSRGRPPTGRHFERVDEVYIQRVHHDRITEAWGIEDNRSRERQLGLSLR